MDTDDMRRMALKEATSENYAVVCALLYIGDILREQAPPTVTVDPDSGLQAVMRTVQ